MDSEHRHELAQNDLAQWLKTSKSSIAPHLVKIGAAVVILLAIYGVFRWNAYSQGLRQTAAWQSFFDEDYQDLIEKSPSTDAARYARLRLAEINIQDAKAAMLDRRDEATRKFETAHQYLDALISDAGTPV